MPDHIETDVLVIGGGMAGIIAAIEAQEQGAKALIVTKGSFGRDGAATWTSGYGFQAAMYPPDSPEIHAQDTIKVGRYLNDQKMVYRLTAEIPRLLEHLDAWGVKYYKEGEKFVMMRLPGETYPRVPRLDKPGEWAGQEYRRVLTRQVRQRGIQTMDDIFIIDLLTCGGEVVGALGLDIREGEPRPIRARATILATGGHMGCYRVTTIPQASGDGCAMAFRVGASIMDMEFADFYTYTAIWPPITVGEIWPSVFKYEMNGVLLNGLGEDFMKRYTGQQRVPPLAILREVKAGRGSPHGGAYLSIRHVPRDLVEKVLRHMGNPKWMKRLEAMGFDLFKQDVEVAPAGIVSFGGCKIDLDGRTDLPRLYAAGEVAAGREGAYTNAGNSLPLCMALGAFAGRAAGREARSGEGPEIDWDDVERLWATALAPLVRARGERPLAVKRAIQDILGQYTGLIGRTAESLQKGLEAITLVKEQGLPEMALSVKCRRFNAEWLEALEVRNSTAITELTLRGALARTESRGLHFREDFPQQDPNWLKHIIFKLSNGGVKHSTEAVTFDYCTPPEQVR